MEKQSPESTTEEHLAGKFHDLLTDSDDDNDANQFPFEEKTIEQVMQEFYKEIIACPKQPISPTTPLPEPKLEEILPVAESSGEFAELGNIEDVGDFDGEWLSRVLNWGQGKVGDTNQCF